MRERLLRHQTVFCSVCPILVTAVDGTNVTGEEYEAVCLCFGAVLVWASVSEENTVPIFRAYQKSEEEDYSLHFTSFANS